MTSGQAYAKLRGLGVPIVETAEAAALLRQSAFAASKTLARLAASGLVSRIRSGTWWIDGPVQPHRVAPHLTAPFPSYLSLHTALRLRGLIEQIPVIVYVVTLDRARLLRTSVGTFSLHHIRPELFGGFELLEGVPVASAEKALFDLAYLAGRRSKLKAGVPELELPRRFRRREIERWVARIPSQRARALTQRRIDAMLSPTRKP
jgi:predicted transcriptional regulator of viral defense system